MNVSTECLFQVFKLKSFMSSNLNHFYVWMCMHGQSFSQENDTDFWTDYPDFFRLRSKPSAANLQVLKFSQYQVFVVWITDKFDIRKESIHGLSSPMNEGYIARPHNFEFFTAVSWRVSAFAFQCGSLGKVLVFINQLKTQLISVFSNDK